jgi:hypothetical protein
MAVVTRRHPCLQSVAAPRLLLLIAFLQVEVIGTDGTTLGPSVSSGVVTTGEHWSLVAVPIVLPVYATYVQLWVWV